MIDVVRTDIIFSTGHYFDDDIIPGLRDRQEDYKVFDVPRKISTAGGLELNGIAQGVLQGHAIDDKGVRRLIQLSCQVSPSASLGHAVPQPLPADACSDPSVFFVFFFPYSPFYRDIGSPFLIIARYMP